MSQVIYYPDTRCATYDVGVGVEAPRESALGLIVRRVEEMDKRAAVLTEQATTIADRTFGVEPKAVAPGTNGHGPRVGGSALLTEAQDALDGLDRMLNALQGQIARLQKL